MSGRVIAAVLASLGLFVSGCGLTATNSEPAEVTAAETGADDARAVKPGTEPGAKPDTKPSTAAEDEAAAIRAARAKGSRVEVASGKTETREVYAEPNGTLTAVISTGPKRVRRDGKWLPVDAKVERRSDGSVGPKAVPIDLTFSGGGTKQPMVSYGKAGKNISLTWPGRLPAPKLDGDRPRTPKSCRALTWYCGPGPTATASTSWSRTPRPPLK
jgi:hypothetical protein